MSVDVPLIRDLLTQITQWPGASAEARRLASVMWHDATDPDPDLMGSMMARLTGELRLCRHTRDPQVAAVAAALRDQVTALVEAQPTWRVTRHGEFAARTRRAANAAGLDLTAPRGDHA